jgi:hypothetical protein
MSVGLQRSMVFVGRAIAAVAKCPTCEVVREWNDELRLENRRLSELITPSIRGTESYDSISSESPVPISTVGLTTRARLALLTRQSAIAAKNSSKDVN